MIYLLLRYKGQLSKEIASSLRGRAITTEIFPFSFAEFLHNHKIASDISSSLGSKKKASLENGLDRFFILGGFPEIQELDKETRFQVLRNYMDGVILRDIIERHKVENVVALRMLIRHILNAPATRLSVNKFYHSLKSQGIKCTKNDLYGFLDHLSDAFFIYPVPLHSRSAFVRRVNPNKIYVIDQGLIRAHSMFMTENRGALLENIVYMHLRRQGFEPTYYLTKEGTEVDFVVQKKSSPSKALIQVCWELTHEETKNRERRVLKTAMKELKVKESLIVTWADEGDIDKSIAVVPLWKWLLG